MALLLIYIFFHFVVSLVFTNGFLLGNKYIKQMTTQSVRTVTLSSSFRLEAKKSKEHEGSWSWKAESRPLRLRNKVNRISLTPSPDST